MIGESDAMRELGSLLARVADTEATVLVTGESGTGKELVARSLHQQSRRARGPFVAVNCAAVTDTLLESELFGHVRGAFTDASRDREGLFEQASGGTLFLDEVAEIPLGMQAKLLRVLQERRVRPIGSAKERPVDVRLIAATNKNLAQALAQAAFRKDLFYRINVVTVDVPPLRGRGDDALLLAQSFVTEIARRSQRAAPPISKEAAQALLAYDWPGNVRELHNSMQRAVALAGPDEPIGLAHLPADVRRALEQPNVLPPAIEDPALPQLSEVERRYIHHVLEHVHGNKTRAAEVLGIDRRTLHRKLKRMKQANGAMARG